jgi:hypothetical protein
MGEMDEFNDREIAKLLRLKRYEQPPPGYFENFLHEFHRRQRDELLRQPLWQIALSRAHDFMLSLNVARLASYPAAVTAMLVCAAVVSLRFYQTPAGPRVGQSAPVVSTQKVSGESWSLAEPVSTSVAVSQPRIRHSNLMTHRPATPPRYVLDSMPVSYEPTLRF